MRITVTTTSDAANGVTPSVGGLISNPGPDGISLREAILATNSDPGRYEIRFAPKLAGADIRVGSATGLDLPTLVGGGLWIDGDIDGDGRPDVTLRGFRPPTYCTHALFLCPGLRVSSSGNRLQTLALRGFAIGVLFTPSPASDPLTEEFNIPIDTHHTYANNVVSGLVMSDIASDGILMIWGSRECDISSGKRAWACETHNSWTDTRLVRNTIETRAYGIQFKLSSSIGDRVERFTVADNTIQIRKSRATEHIGIHFEAGLGVGSVRNHISDVLIARNTIIGDLDRGVRLAAGAGASDANIVERVRIIDNRVDFTNGGREGWGAGISVFLGESSELIGWNLRPIQYGDRNLVRVVEITGNTLRGNMNIGVDIETGCCGGTRNRVEGLRIERNTIRMSGLRPQAGVKIDAGSCCDSDEERRTKGNRVSGVSIDANRITIRSVGSPEAEFGQPVGGIVLMPGIEGSQAGEIRNVRVSNNRIGTGFLGISLFGGAWWYRSSEAAEIPVSDALDQNRLACVVLRENLVEGVRDEVSVIVSAAHPESLSHAARDAAWKACSWSPDQFEVAAAEGTEAKGPPREESGNTSGGVPWPLILLGVAGASAGAFLLIRLRRPA